MARCRNSCKVPRRAIGAILALLLAACGTVGQHNSANIVTSSSSSNTLSRNVPVTTTTEIHSLPGRPAFDPQSVTFVSSSLGWAWGPGPEAATVGPGPGLLAQTTNYGRTWAKVATPGISSKAIGTSNTQSEISGVRFINSKVGFLFGSVLYATTNGGASWNKISSPGPVNDIEAGSAGIYALIESCTPSASCPNAGLNLYRVTSNSFHFIHVGPTQELSLGSKLVAKGSSVYLLAQPLSGASGNAQLWRSLNGSGWQSVPAPCAWFGAAFGAIAAWSDTGLALVCGGQPSTGTQPKTAYSSVNAGSTWSKAMPIASKFGYVLSLAAANSTTWILGEARGTMLVTHDGGQTWSNMQVTHPGGGAGEGWGFVGFTSSSEAVAVPWTLNGSALAFSYNGARTWTMVAFPSGR